VIDKYLKERKGIEKVAKQMKLRGEPIEKIIEYTNLTKDQIERL